MAHPPSQRLSRLDAVTGPAQLPGYAPKDHGVGIVHLGVGAFHRAHQAAYTDTALAAEGGDWRIFGVSLRSADVPNRLAPQNGLYTLIERGSGGTHARVIGAVDTAVALTSAHREVLQRIVAPSTRIVSLTVTEKAYGIDRGAMAADPAHPAVAADLASPDAPTGVLGLLTLALAQRRAAGHLPFTVLCCDNLPDNGPLLGAGVVDFARRLDPDLSAWIAEMVPFPATMVDRITPATTPETLADAARATGCTDTAAVETEPFSQWVIEDCFASGRPSWEAGGAMLVSDVAPYEQAKLRMLNGAHSMLAYAGQLSGCTYVRDVMAHSGLRARVADHMTAAARTVPPLALDLAQYQRDLMERFTNTAIAHQTAQIAMDGSQKMPQRIFAPAVEAAALGHDIGPFAFAAAAWMAFCANADALDDPRTDVLRLASAHRTAEAISTAFHALPDLVPGPLRSDAAWRLAVAENLHRFLSQGPEAAVAQEATASDKDAP